MYNHIKENQIEPFKEWLDKQGAEVLAPTNPYELVRFKTVNGVSIIYTGKRGQSFVGESDQAFEAFLAGKRWVATDRKRKHLTNVKDKLAERDGKGCFWCQAPLETNRLTAEHILNKMHGGSDNHSNLSLACKPCQLKLGSLPITKKILIRDSLLAKAHLEIPTVKKAKPNIFKQFMQRMRRI